MTKDEHDAFLEALDAVRARNADLFAGLTSDEVRVITGLVKAMRESKPFMPFVQTARTHVIDAKDDIQDLAAMGLRDDRAERLAAHAAWHIAHAISQMGES